MEKLNCKSFMIGDWAYNISKQQPEQVAEIYERKVMMAYNDLYDYDEIEPIPLTPEILEKNGFEEWDGWLIYSPEGTGIEIAWVGTILKIGGECGNLELPAIEYVHQLQNVFMLCGISKEIVL